MDMRETFSDVKDRLQALIGIPPDQQGLIAHKHRLEDHETLASRGLRDNHYICLVLRLRGC